MANFYARPDILRKNSIERGLSLARAQELAPRQCHSQPNWWDN